MGGTRYPESEMEFAPAYPDDIPECWQRFFDLREDLLLDYGYNTARAYWGDLQGWFEWAVEREKDVLALTEKDVKQYRTLLRRRKYSENTIRRRLTALRLLRRVIAKPARAITSVADVLPTASHMPMHADRQL